MGKYTFIEHTADIKFHLIGKTINDLFEQCVLAISEVISRGNRIKSIKKKIVSISAQDRESLLYQFIDHIIYLLDAEYFIVSKAKVLIEKNKLKATLFGDDSKNYDDLDQIKAATYAEMKLKRSSIGWETDVVLDV